VNEGKPLWGGRFATQPNADLMKLSSSIGFDIVLLPYDLAATKAHARVLEKAGYLEPDAVFAVADACDAIEASWRGGTLEVDAADEDVHSLVERLLTEQLGETGKRIHAGRSRNDLVATDLRLWCRDAAEQLSANIAGLVETLAGLAETNRETIMPGYTHLQRAQPVTLGFHLCAHAFALARDLQRVGSARDAADVSALGAGALAGTTLDLDPSVAASELGFTRQFDNAMDAVSDRDFVCDLAYAAAMCCVHLSRLAEEIVLWTSSEFGFATLSDAWSTGSSMMPQKRNPDMAELIRGRAAPTIGELTALLTLIKGLPLAYDRDLQEDKQLIFTTVHRTLGCLEGMTGLLASLTFDVSRLSAAAGGGGSWATDLAERLVARGVPFREAHSKVGSLVAALEKDDQTFSDLTTDSLKAIDPAFVDGDLQAGDVVASVASRNNPGSTSPERVLEQIERLRALIR
jgi:argininosuccinate lyase